MAYDRFAHTATAAPEQQARDEVTYGRRKGQTSQRDYDRSAVMQGLAKDRADAISAGKLPGSLPAWNNQTSDADLVKFQRQMNGHLGRPDSYRHDAQPQPAGSPVDQRAQSISNPGARQPGQPASPETYAARVADAQLFRDFYEGPNGPPKPKPPPDIHTDLRDSPEHGSINPIPGQPLRSMARNADPNWNYPAQAPAAEAAAAPRQPYQSGRVISAGADYDPAQDSASPVAGVNARAVANPGVAQTVATPYGPAGVRMPTWQELLVKQYPEIGRAGTSANDSFVKAFKSMGNDPAKAAQIAANIYGAKQQDPTAPGGAAYQSPIVAADGTSKLGIGASTATGTAGATPGQPVAPVNFAGFDVGTTDIKPPESAPLTYAKEAGQNARSRWEEQMQDPLSPRNLANAADKGLTNVFSGAVDAVGGFFNPNWKSVRPPDKPIFPNNPAAITNPETPGKAPAPGPGVDTSSALALTPYNWSTPSKPATANNNFAPQPFTIDNPSGATPPLVKKKKEDEYAMSGF